MVHIETDHPHVHSLGPTILSDIIPFAREFASTYAATQAAARYPEITTLPQWDKDWEIGWNSAYNYATEGLTYQQLYSIPTSPGSLRSPLSRNSD